MGKYLDRTHNVRGLPTSYTNRVDLDTALKERELEAGLYPKGSEEKKELHQFLIKRARQVGHDRAVEKVKKGKIFNTKDMQKI